MSGENPLAVADIRPFAPTENTHSFLAIYPALGWTTPWGRNGLAQLSLVGHQLLLQNFDVEDWAENSTLVVEVADAVAR